jgi:hypothetical protein
MKCEIAAIGTCQSTRAVLRYPSLAFRKNAGNTIRMPGHLSLRVSSRRVSAWMFDGGLSHGSSYGRCLSMPAHRSDTRMGPPYGDGIYVAEDTDWNGYVRFGIVKVRREAKQAWSRALLRRRTLILCSATNENEIWQKTLPTPHFTCIGITFGNYGGVARQRVRNEVPHEERFNVTCNVSGAISS